MGRKLVGYARVSTRHQDADRQEVDLRAAGVRADDLYVDRGASGAHASRPALDAALRALEAGDTLVVPTLDRLGRSTGNMLDLAQELRTARVALRVLNLGGGDVDTSTPMGSMMFTVMSALAQMELEVKRERVLDSVSKRRASGADLGGRPRKITDSQLRNAAHLVAADVPVAEVARSLGISRSTLYRRLQAGNLVDAELPEVAGGTHPPALHGLTVPIKRP